MLLLLPDLFLDNARVWDGTGAPVQEGVDLLVHDGRIVAIGSDLTPPEGARLLDVSGATVIPGLIDSHVHLSMDPGAAHRHDAPAEHRVMLAQHLRAYLACGVTTILDPAVLPEELALIRSTLAEGTPGPRYLPLGPPFAPRGGYPAVVIPTLPTVATPAEVERQLDLVVAEGVVGIKTTVEQGFGPHVWPLYAPEVSAAIRDGARARTPPVYSHAVSPKEQRIAMEALGATVLVHPLEPARRKAVERAAAAGVYEMSTLSILDSMLTLWEPERLDDPLIRLTVPARELATARDPAVGRAFASEMIATIYPMLPRWDLVRRVGFTRRTAEHRLTAQGEAVRALHDAGVPIVMGSDAGNWPIIPFEFHGPTSIRELEVLGEHGFSPAEALTSATATPARMLGLDVGTLVVGQGADLVVVEGDPLVDLRALRTVRYTVRAGDARTPTEWMGGPS